MRRLNATRRLFLQVAGAAALPMVSVYAMAMARNEAASDPSATQPLDAAWLPTEFAYGRG